MRRRRWARSTLAASATLVGSLLTVMPLAAEAGPAAHSFTTRTAAAFDVSRPLSELARLDMGTPRAAVPAELPERGAVPVAAGRPGARRRRSAAVWWHGSQAAAGPARADLRAAGQLRGRRELGQPAADLPA